MYKHILVPTDGSRLAEKGVKSGVRLAKALSARITGVFVIAPYMPPIYGDAAVYIPGIGRQDYEKLMKKEARKALEFIEREAKTAGVRCVTQTVTESQPWKGILRAARLRKCDVIAMASHGRGGLGALLLGSETSNVLTHSKIPVLVAR